MAKGNLSVWHKGGKFYATIYGRKFTSTTAAGLRSALPLLLHQAGVPKSRWPAIIRFGTQKLREVEKGAKSHRYPWERKKRSSSTKKRASSSSKSSYWRRR